MKVLIALDHSGFFRHFDTVVSSLVEGGHRVKVITRLGPRGGEDYQRVLLEPLAGSEAAGYDIDMRKRRDSRAQFVTDVRGALDYAIYLRRQHNSPRLAERRADRCPPRLRRFADSWAGRALVSRDWALRAYRRAHFRLPADPDIRQQVAGEEPDVVVACPMISPQCRDLEYVRAGQELGVPTVCAIASWDNLSTKGAFHLLPDAVLVWNQRLADEVQEIHALPADRLVITGGPKFDHYFGRGPSLSRREFCAHVGIDPELPYLMYLGSSEKVAGDETGEVRELADALHRHPDTSGVHLVVRPHPINGQVWEGFGHEGVTVFPPLGARPDVEGPRDDYFNTLSHAAAVMGINTTAFLEAAIADRPCLTVVNDRHRQGQLDRGHFQHLVSGRFIETAADFDGAAALLGAVLARKDRLAAQRRRFVESFVRPGGIGRPAGEVTAQAIVATASAGPRPREPLRRVRGARPVGPPPRVEPAAVEAPALAGR